MVGRPTRIAVILSLSLTLVLLAAPHATAQANVPDWVFAPVGTSPGLSGVHVSRLGFASEIVIGGQESWEGHRNWHLLRYLSGDGSYQQVFSSPSVAAGDGISAIRVADVAPASGPELITSTFGGSIEIWNQTSRTRLTSFRTAASYLFAMDVGDLDGDAKAEIVVATSNRLEVYGVDGRFQWALAGVGGFALVIGQLDTDKALEIALTDGRVVDGVTRQVEWHYKPGFGDFLELGDIDSDGRDELVSIPKEGNAHAWDVELKKSQWSLPVRSVTASFLGDLNGNGTWELLIGDSWRRLESYDARTLTKNWSIYLPTTSPVGSAAGIGLGDPDRDGKNELVLGCGGGSPANGEILVLDVATRNVEWRSNGLSGPFGTVAVGDVNGDGLPDLVTASPVSGHPGPRLLTFDALTLRLQPNWGVTTLSQYGKAAPEVRLINMDQDPALEVMVVENDIADGTRLWVFDFDGKKLTTIWQNPYNLPQGPHRSSVIADIDGDSDLDVVIGARNLLIYDYATKALLWQSPATMSTMVVRTEVANTDQDSALEILALTEDGKLAVIDGKSYSVEATLPGPYTALAPFDIGSRSLILLGDKNGKIWVIDHDGTGYRPLGAVGIAVEPIEGIAAFPPALLLVGAGGRAHGLVWGHLLWRSDDLGPGTGRSFALSPRGRMIFTTTEHGIAGFRF